MLASAPRARSVCTFLVAIVAVHGGTSAFGPSDTRCVKDEHGPACKADSDCKEYPQCVRCAHSGFCTVDPPPSPHPPSPGPPSPSGGTGTAGDYDLIIFARFWMGEPAMEIKCGTYAANSLTLHGIWPQYTAARNGAYWPQNCNASHNQVLPGVAAKFAPMWKQYAPAYPASSNLKFSDLASHEWAKHGTCWSAAISTVGSNTQALSHLEDTFFQASLDLNQKYPTPKVLQDAQAAGATLAVSQLQAAFGGPSKVALSCKGSTLNMVSLCLSKDMTAQVNCPPSTLQSSYDNGCVTSGVTQLQVAYKCS